MLLKIPSRDGTRDRAYAEGVIVDFSCSVMNLGDCVRGSGAGGVTGDSFLVFLNVGDC